MANKKQQSGNPLLEFFVLVLMVIAAIAYAVGMLLPIAVLILTPFIIAGYIIFIKANVPLMKKREVEEFNSYAAVYDEVSTKRRPTQDQAIRRDDALDNMKRINDLQFKRWNTLERWFPMLQACLFSVIGLIVGIMICSFSNRIDQVIQVYTNIGEKHLNAFGQNRHLDLILRLDLQIILLCVSGYYSANIIRVTIVEEPEDMLGLEE